MRHVLDKHPGFDAFQKNKAGEPSLSDLMENAILGVFNYRVLATS